MSNTVTIKFENETQAKCFMTWLDNSGEQEYFMVADLLEGEKGQDFVNNFEYDRATKTITGSTI